VSAVGLLARVVTPSGPGAYDVSDGRDTDGIDPHRVEIRGDIARCNCKGFQYRHRCRHLDAVGEYLRGAPIAAVPVGPAFDEAPPPESPDEDLGDELEDGPCTEALSSPAHQADRSTPPDPFAQLVERWRAKKAQLIGEQAMAS
jgi:hypothetical protein